MSSEALDCVDGDTFRDEDQLELFRELKERGEVIASRAQDHGWGHHNANIVVKMDDKFYFVKGGGCSCGGSASVEGPFDTREEAGHEDLPLGDNYSR